MRETVAHPLDSARLKVERTWQHLEQFNAQARSFFETQPYAFTLGPADGEEGWTAIYVHVRRKAPDHLSLVFGDAVHNLRSALDHLAYQLALVLGTGPGRRTQWPIFDDAANFARLGDPYLAGIVEPQRTRVANLQPFKDPDGLRWLSLLHELDIADKHHVLGQSIPAPTDVEVVLPTGTVHVRNSQGPVYVEDGAQIMRFKLPVDPGAPEVRMDTKFRYMIFVGDRNRAIASEAILIWSYGVLEILDSFAADFP
jgi:hypothetical protein